MKNKYVKTAVSIYINYIIVGVSVIILSLNMDSLMAQWGTNKAGFGLVTSGIGIGKFVVLFISGMLSDRFGRKPFIVGGMIGFIVFFLGVLFSPTTSVAIVFAVVAGVANAMVDAGSYAALMEAYPESPGTANLIVKVFVAAGQFALPVFVSFILANNLYFGISFYVLVAILGLNLLFMLKCKFPPLTKKTEGEKVETAGPAMKEQPKLYLEGLALVLYGFTSTAGLTISQMWLPKIGEEVAGMSVTSSNAILSYFSIGTLVSVFVTAYLVKSKLRPAAVTFLYPVISIAMAAVWYLFPTPMVCSIAGFVMGYSIAGGILQMAITALSEFFPGNGGKCTGAVNSLNSIAIWSIPAITGMMADRNIKDIIILIGGICAVGAVLGFIAMVRDRKVFGR